MTEQYPNNVEIHRWAQAQPWGHKVSTRQLSRQLIVAWDKAHPDRPYVKKEAHHGTLGGIGRDCTCARCREAHNAYRRDRVAADREDEAS